MNGQWLFCCFICQWNFHFHFISFRFWEKVQSVSILHISVFSSLFSMFVPAEMPGPPTNIAISNIGPRSVALQFKPGYDGKTSISRWVVEAQVMQTAPVSVSLCCLHMSLQNHQITPVLFSVFGPDRCDRGE